MKDKKVLVIVGVVIAVLVLAVAIFMRGRGGATEEVEEENVPELPVHMRPVTRLVPTEDGHYLNLIVENISVPGASMMEYEILYDTAAGIQQGIPGRVTLADSGQSVERELLLGSESSGKFRYDEGVEDGTITLKFRDIDGKFIGKTETVWMLYSDTDTLSSQDGIFTYNLEESSEEFFVVMQTFGLPNPPEGNPVGPYGVFSSSLVELPGGVRLSGEVYILDGENWEPLDGNSSDNIGIFLGVQ